MKKQKKHKFGAFENKTDGILRTGARTLGFSALITVLTGCGGGGGGGGSSSEPVPAVSSVPNSNASSAPSGTLTPSPSSSANTIPFTALSSVNCRSGVDILSQRRAQSLPPITAPSASVYTLDSNPQGLPVYVNSTRIGTTPTSTTPVAADATYVVTIGTNTQNVNYCYSQMANGAKSVFFNTFTDTTGSIASVSTSALARASSSIVPTSFHEQVIRHTLRQAPSAQFASDRLLVKYRSSSLVTGGRSALDIERQAGVSSAVNLGPQNGSLLSRVIQVSAGSNLSATRAKLAADPTVAEVDPIALRYPLSVSAVSPNDPEFATNDKNQWNLYQIQAPLGWGISTGNASISIAIIDTGYDTNAPDLKTKVSYQESIINGTVNTAAGAAQDQDGHGTNVSGIAAAATNNGVGVAGVGFNVTLQEYRIFTVASDGTTNASTTDEAQAIYDAVARNAKVISLSLGGTEGANGGIDAAEYDAIEYAIAHNVTVVAAAGNERSASGTSLITSVDYPAAYPGVIAVGASALNDSKSPNSRTAATEYVASYSNSGPGLALVAPGGDPASDNDTDPLHWILNLDTSTPIDPKNMCSHPANCLAQFAGTSQATPHVSGAAALMLSINPSLAPNQIRSILMANADNINDPRQGAGRLNVYRALAAVSGQSVSAPSYQNFVAFGYANSGSNSPQILDLSFPQGIPVNSDGSFRVSDLPVNPANYRIAVWDDANGNGIIDAGDFIGVSGPCVNTAPCNASGIAVSPVGTNYTLP